MFLKQRNLQKLGGKDFLLILLGFYINLFLANVTISYTMNSFSHKIKDKIKKNFWRENMRTFARNRLKASNSLCLNIPQS